MNTGDLSTLLVWGAATAFTVALIAYSVDLARIADRAQKRVPRGACRRRRAGVPPPPSPVRRRRAHPAGRSRAEGIARSTTLLGLALLFAGIVLRGIAAGRWPTANMYEFTLVGVFVAVLVLTIVQRRRVIALRRRRRHGHLRAGARRSRSTRSTSRPTRCSPPCRATG